MLLLNLNYIGVEICIKLKLCGGGDAISAVGCLKRAPELLDLEFLIFCKKEMFW